MKRMLSLALLSLMIAVPTSTAVCQGSCCKICRKGKACGDSCIAADRVCSQRPGCACNG